MGGGRGLTCVYYSQKFPRQPARDPATWKNVSWNCLPLTDTLKAHGLNVIKRRECCRGRVSWDSEWATHDCRHFHSSAEPFFPAGRRRNVLSRRTNAITVKDLTPCMDGFKGSETCYPYPRIFIRETLGEFYLILLLKKIILVCVIILFSHLGPG